MHLCGVAQTTTVRDLYVNGQYVASNSRTHTVANTTLDLGRYGDSTPNYFDCSVGDPMLHNRALTIPEIQQLADPSNVMLSGLINPPRRKWWPVVSGAAPSFKSYWANQATQVAM